MNIKSENQANITIVNALNNLDNLLEKFRFGTNESRQEIAVAIKFYAGELETATDYITEVNAK
jgi:hypothetical protein